jgi:hypothetical protein
MAYDPTILHWPRILGPHSPGWGLASGAQDGPTPLLGPPQTNFAPSGVLRLRLRLSVFDPATGGDRVPVAGRVHALLAIKFGALDVGAPVYMPMFAWRRGPRARAGLPLFGDLTTFSDSATFSDGSTFAANAGDALVAVAAALGAWRVTIEIFSAIEPTAGDFVGFGDCDRCHLITGIWRVDDHPTWRELRLDRPLRAALDVGDHVEFADPICRMRLAQSSRGALLDLERGRKGESDLDFVEANWTAA